jgi:hypothetical protein
LPFIRIGLTRSDKFVEDSTELTCLEISGYRIKYGTVLWLLEFQIRRVRKVWTKVRTVNSNSRTSDCQFSLFSKRNPIIYIFCISGWLAVPINPYKWSSAAVVGYSKLFSEKGKVAPVHAIQAYRGSTVIAPPILNLINGGNEWSPSRPGCFIPRERTSVPIE